jgi:hypothetical protein
VRTTHRLSGLANSHDLEDIEPERACGGERDVGVVGRQNQGSHFRLCRVFGYMPRCPCENEGCSSAKE